MKLPTFVEFSELRTRPTIDLSKVKLKCVNCSVELNQLKNFIVLLANPNDLTDYISF